MLVVLYVYHAFITYTFMQIGLDGECDRLEYTRLMLPFLDCQIVSPVHHWQLIVAIVNDCIGTGNIHVSLTLKGSQPRQQCIICFIHGVSL
jgi:hypothetical protein